MAKSHESIFPDPSLDDYEQRLSPGLSAMKAIGSAAQTVWNVLPELNPVTAGERMGAAIYNMPTPGPDAVGRAVQGTIARGGRQVDPVVNVPNPSSPPNTFSAAIPAQETVLPATAPTPQKRTSADFLKEINASQQGARDLPAELQQFYKTLPPPKAEYVEANKGRPSWEVGDPTLKAMQMSRTPEERANLAPTLEAKLATMFPGMNKGSRGTLVNQLYGLVQPSQTNQAQGGVNFQGLAAAAAEKPVYKTLSPGQTLFQIDKQGTSKQVASAPGETSAIAAGKQKETQQAMDMHKPVRAEYAKNWDKITEDIADPNERTKALRSLNSQYFQGMGVPEAMANIPQSFKLYVEDKMKEAGITTITAKETKQLEQTHRSWIKGRNQLLKQFYNGKLEFGGYTENK